MGDSFFKIEIRDPIPLGFPGGSVVKNPPASMEDTGLISDLGRFHMPQNNYTHAAHPTGHDQEGRRGLNEVVPGTSVFPLSETGVLGDFWGRIKGAKYRFAFQDGTWDIF